MEPLTLSIFFPAYNEQDNIREAIRQTTAVLDSSPYIHDYEIIVVNDGSTDATKKIVEEIIETNQKVRLINHRTNLGYGATLKDGIRAARMDYIFFTDADLQFDLLELTHLLVYVSQYPVVIGYRSPRRDPFMRLLNAWGWNKLNLLFFGLSVKDIDCAFKIFRRKEIQNMNILSDGAMINAEILIRLNIEGVPIKEVPVIHYPRVAGVPTGAKLSVIGKALREMFVLYRTDLGSPKQKQMVKYINVGIINTLLDAAAYVILTRGISFFSDHLTIAKFLSFMAGTVSSLVLNHSWTFQMENRISLGEIIRFYSVTVLTITTNVFIMNFLVSLGMYDLYALALTTVFTFIVGFSLSRLWVFKTLPEEQKLNSKSYATN